MNFSKKSLTYIGKKYYIITINSKQENKMQKTKLNKFIQKYNLGGNVNSVKWKSQDKILSTNF